MSKHKTGKQKRAAKLRTKRKEYRARKRARERSVEAVNEPRA
ncbi:hypothetical protein [Tardiphaga sp. 841_E9_N1_2]